MGVFNSLNNKPNDADEDVGKYITFEQINAESVMNELDIFNEMIDLDFIEQEMVLHEVQILIPASVFINLYEKVKNFIKKIFSKIKRVIDNIIIYFSGSLINKNKEFARRYGRQLRKKILNNLDGLKLEYYEKLFNGTYKNSRELYGDLEYYTPNAEKYKLNVSIAYAQKLKNDVENFDADEHFEKVTTALFGRSYSKSDLHKEMEENVLGDKDTYDEDNDLKKIVRQSLEYLEVRADDDLKAFKKSKHYTEKAFKGLLRDLEKTNKMVENLAANSTDTDYMMTKAYYGEIKSRRDAHKRVVLTNNRKTISKIVQNSNNHVDRYLKKDKNGNATRQNLENLSAYKTWLTLFTKRINVVKDVIISIMNSRYKIVQKMCLTMRTVCVKAYMFKLKKEDAFYEAFSDEDILNYINFVDDYKTDIIL